MNKKISLKKEVTEVYSKSIKPKKMKDKKIKGVITEDIKLSNLVLL